MKHKGPTLLACSIAMVVGGCATQRIPPPPVAAPAGYRWVLNEPYSDEFNGRRLDTAKWHDHYPGWKGRVPGKYIPSSVTVDDGSLQITCTMLAPPQGDSNQWWIACGAIQSKAQEARYGYYETRMKASSLRTSSTFWLMNPQGEGKRTELDIQECIGNARRWPGFKRQFRNNTHVTFPTKDEDGEHDVAKKGASTDLVKKVDEAFHRYGCWWIDANTMRFYLDGEHVQTIVPSTDRDASPFDQPMFINLVCEIYDWEELPERDRLLDDALNTTYYDYVRSYKLIEER